MPFVTYVKDIAFAPYEPTTYSRSFHTNITSTYTTISSFITFSEKQTFHQERSDNLFFTYSTNSFSGEGTSFADTNFYSISEVNNFNKVSHIGETYSESYLNMVAEADKYFARNDFYSYTFSASYDTAASQIITSGNGTRSGSTEVYAISLSTSSSQTEDVGFISFNFTFAHDTTTTNVADNIYITTSSTGEYTFTEITNTNILNTATYSFITNITTGHIYTSIKTTHITRGDYSSYGQLLTTAAAEWIGLSPSGNVGNSAAGNVAIFFTAPDNNIFISDYHTILAETDSFTYLTSLTSYLFTEGSFAFSENAETYTLIYDETTAELSFKNSTIYDLQFAGIDLQTFWFFLNSRTEEATITYASTFSISETFTSTAIELGINSPPLTNAITYNWSTTKLQNIYTAKNFTIYSQNNYGSGYSFEQRFVIVDTIEGVYGGNAVFITDGYNVFSPAPLFSAENLGIYASDRRPDVGYQPSTFYTEEATLGNFVSSPSYSNVYYDISPDATLAVITLGAVGHRSTYAYSIYPNYVSVYIGSIYIDRDRQNTTLRSCSLYQTSSSALTGSNIYQTISYYIGNDPQSQTTKETSFYFGFSNSASSVFITQRTNVDNDSTAYWTFPQPQIPVRGYEVFYTNGIQGSASYNLNGMMINAYTSLSSKFVTYATDSSSFPVRIGEQFYLFPPRQKIDVIKGDYYGSSAAIPIQGYRDLREDG
jgi:hypothetical protein